jgi:oxygen-independent coproporphyrinogen III oxidase
MDAPWGEPRALYIHVPFCRHRCGYCDFTLVAGRDDLIDRYLAALDRELRFVLPDPVEIDTLFFGGGTPSHLEPGQLAALFQSVLPRVKTSKGLELSVEANPLDLTAERLAVMREFCVNRVSIGVQSFDAAELRMLERDHSPEEAREAISRTQRVIPNVGIDLIFGVPGQSLESWRRNVEVATSLDPSHVSTYGLTFEKGTAYWTRRMHGEIHAVPDETELAMYEFAMDRLPSAELPQYELSNFAKPGFECRHNHVYWDARSYYAVGPGAASYLKGVRRTNHRSTTAWMNKVLNGTGEAPAGIVEDLSPEERAREAVMLGLRRTSGIDATAFEERFGYSLETLGGPSMTKMVERGLLESNSGCLRLTLRGRCLADTVIAEFLSSL